MALIPAAWTSLVEREGLVAGFGNRDEGPPDDCMLVEQVHGADVAVCDSLDARAARAVAADALVVTQAGRTVGVRTADCVPLLLVARARRERWAAAVHAGWRGTIAGVAAAALADARARGIGTSALSVALGPSIGGCCYEVDENVASRFRRAGLPVVDTGAKPHLDLRDILRELLVRQGIVPANVSACGPCTRCRSDRYHSYRAAPERAGRQVSWIGWRP